MTDTRRTPRISSARIGMGILSPIFVGVGLLLLQTPAFRKSLAQGIGLLAIALGLLFGALALRGSRSA